MSTFPFVLIIALQSCYLQKSKLNPDIDKSYYLAPENSSSNNSLLFSVLLETVIRCSKMEE